MKGRKNIIIHNNAKGYPTELAVTVSCETRSLPLKTQALNSWDSSCLFLRLIEPGFSFMGTSHAVVYKASCS